MMKIEIDAAALADWLLTSLPADEGFCFNGLSREERPGRALWLYEVRSRFFKQQAALASKFRRRSRPLGSTMRWQLIISQGSKSPETIEWDEVRHCYFIFCSV